MQSNALRSNFILTPEIKNMLTLKIPIWIKLCRLVSILISIKNTGYFFTNMEHINALNYSRMEILGATTQLDRVKQNLGRYHKLKRIKQDR